MNKPQHPHLCALLEYEEQKHGVRINYHRSRNPYGPTSRFQPHVLVTGPPVLPDTDIEVCVDGTLHTFSGRVHVPRDGQQVGVTLDDKLYPLATVDGRHIHVHIDLEGLFEAPTGIPPTKLFESVFEQAMPMAAEVVKGYTWEAETTEYVARMAGQLHEQIRTWRHAIQDNDYEADKLVTRMTNLVRKNHELRDHLKTAESVTADQWKERCRKEFQALLKMVPHVLTDVHLDYGVLRLVTRDITVKHNGHDYELGPFRVIIESEKIRIYSDAARSYPHPHVSVEGVPCWGNLAPHIAKLLGQGEHAALAAAVVRFLESYNPSDAYQGIESFDPDYDTDEDPEY